MQNAEEIIAKAAPNWVLGGLRCIATDPIFMEYIVESVDPSLKTQLLSLQLETSAAVLRTFADAAEKAAQIIAQEANG